MRRFLALFFAFCMLFPLFAACKQEEPETLEENQIEVAWHMGRVASSKDKKNPDALVDGEEGFSYSDVIHIKKAGTEIRFTDDNGEGSADTAYAGKTEYVISHWVKEGENFVLEEPGDHYPGFGGRAEEVVTFEGDQVHYRYVSTFADEYIRLCYSSGQTAENTGKMKFAKVYSEYVKKTGTLAGSYDGATLKNLKVARFLKTSKQEQYFEELSGITMYAMGDSYFGGSKTGIDYVWPNLLARKYEMNFINYGIGGSTISNREGQNYQPMTTRVGAMANGQPQIVLFEGGRNDFSKGVPLGADADNGLDTFCGAINYCLDRLQEKYPNALIIGVTVWAREETRNGQTQADFGKAMMRLCAAKGVPCFNAMDVATTKVNMDDADFRAKYCQDQNDISHLNVDGMILVEPAFERFIAEKYREFLAK